MKLVAKLLVISVFGAACAACSHPQAPSPSSGSSAPSSAIPMLAPAAGGSLVAPLVQGPTFSQVMRRPDFEQAFAGMDGASSLPDWVKHAGSARAFALDAKPSREVRVDGTVMWLATVCQTGACRSGKLIVLIDPDAHRLQGVFVQTSSGAGAPARKFTWLGKPDAAVQAFLKNRTTRD